MNNFSQDSWSLGQDLNPGPPKYEAGVLTTRSQCLVLFLLHLLHVNEENFVDKWPQTATKLYISNHKHAFTSPSCYKPQKEKENISAECVYTINKQMLVIIAIAVYKTKINLINGMFIKIVLEPYCLAANI
jgi:hypothetical protein